MSTLGGSLVVAGLLLLPVPHSARSAAPPSAPVAENISVVDFASSLTYSLTNRPPVRRGVTTAITIKKNLIDLVPFAQVSVSGAGATIANFNRGTSGGTGFLSLRMTVPDGATLGAVITLSVGFTDRFTFRVVNRGAVTSVTKAPDPATLQPGTEWVTTVSGTDLGAPTVQSIPCHTVTAENRSNTSVRFRLQRAATCATSSFQFRLTASAANDPPTWATPTGGATSFGFSYVPPPPSGVTCTSNPNITSPVITRPLNNQVIVFGSGTSSPASVSVAWEARTQPGSIVPPNGEWILVRPVTNQFGLTTNVATTLTTTSTTLSLRIPGTYTMSLRAKNCGQPAPTTTVTFSTRYQ